MHTLVFSLPQYTLSPTRYNIYTAVSALNAEQTRQACHAAGGEPVNTWIPPAWRVDRQETRISEENAQACARSSAKTQTYQGSSGGFFPNPQSSAENRRHRRYGQHLWVQDSELRRCFRSVFHISRCPQAAERVMREGPGGVRRVKDIRGSGSGSGSGKRRPVAARGDCRAIDGPGDPALLSIAILAEGVIEQDMLSIVAYWRKKRTKTFGATATAGLEGDHPREKKRDYNGACPITHLLMHPRSGGQTTVEVKHISARSRSRSI